MGLPADSDWLRVAVARGLVAPDAIALRRPAKGVTEAEFQAGVIDLARSLGWLVAHFRPGRTADGGWVTAVAADGKGYPDLTLVRERVIFAELKAGRNRLTAEQERWRDRLRAAGAAWFEWRPDQWGEIERELRGD